MNQPGFDVEYVQWKKWSWVKTNSAFMDRYYQGEMKCAGLVPGEKILELGFGEGGFLLWGKKNGFDISGVEVIEERCQKGSEYGYDTQHINLSSNDEYVTAFVKEHTGRFQKIIAFDVLEHLDTGQLAAFLRNAKVLLSDKGKIVARVPNASSPFGCLIQNGDITHKTAFTFSSLKQIVQPAGFKCTYFENAFRSYTSKSRLPVFLVLYGVRTLVECVIGYLYWLRRVPLDQAVTFHLEKE